VSFAKEESENVETEAGEVTPLIVPQEGKDEAVQLSVDVKLGEVDFHIQYSTPGNISQVTTTLLSLATTATLSGAGAGEPLPPPRHPSRSMAANATMMNPDNLFIL
jgi:hypothetical protein